MDARSRASRRSTSSTPRGDAHDLDKRTGQGAHRSGALVQQGGRDAGDADRRRPRQRALRAQQRHDLRRLLGLQPRHLVELRQEDRHGHGVGVQRRQPAARRAQRRRDRAALAGEPGSDAAARAADLRAESSRTSTMPRARRRSGAPASVRAALDAAKEKNVEAAGFVETSAQIQAVATSKGQFGYDRFTAADYNLTARTPDGTGSGWASKSFNELRLLDPRGAGVGRDRQGRALAQPDGDRAGQVHGGARAGGDGRPDRQPGVRGGRAADRRGAELLREKGRRQPRRRADRRREGAALLRSDLRAGAGDSVRRRGAAAQADRLDRQGRAEEPVVFALLGAEAGQGSRRRSPAT